MHGKGLREDLRPALIAAGFAGAAGVPFGMDLKPATPAAFFFAAFAVYFADHHLPARSRWTWPVIGTASLLFAVCLRGSGQLAAAGVAGYVGLALLYVLPWGPGGLRLQDRPLLRVAAIVLGWAAIPLLLKGFPINLTGGMYLLAHAGYLLPAVIFSDLADAEDDRRQGRISWLRPLTRSHTAALIRLASVTAVCGYFFSGAYGMLPGPLLYLFGLKYLYTKPERGDGVLLWPLIYWAAAEIRL